MGFIDFLDDVGDGITGSLTFGQCDGSGCNGDHRGRGLNPVGMVANKFQGVDQRGSFIAGTTNLMGGGPQQPGQQAGQQFDFGNMFGPNNSQLTGLIKPGLIVIGGIIVIELVLKLI